jgi:hypothetical protein
VPNDHPLALDRLLADLRRVPLPLQETPAMTAIALFAILVWLAIGGLVLASLFMATLSMWFELKDQLQERRRRRQAP